MASDVARTIHPLTSLIALIAAATLAFGAVGCDKSGGGDSGDAASTQKNASAKGGNQADDQSSDDEASAAKDQPHIKYDDGPQPGPDTVLASAGDIEVTLADFQTAMRQSKLVAPEGVTEISKERLAAPYLQMNVVRNLLTSKIIAQEAKKRGIEATRAEKVAALKSKKRLAEYAPLLEKAPEPAANQADKQANKTPEALAKRGLSLADLDAVATDLVLRARLRDALIDELTDEQLWRAWSQSHDRAKLLLVGVRNTPTIDEITDFIDQHHDRIEKYFDKHKKRYRTPTMAVLTTLAPKAGDKVDAAKLEKAAARLKQGEVASKIGKELGLQAQEKAKIVRGENAEAFGAEPGETGFQTEGPRGAYAWKKVETIESKPAELDGAVEREIAAQILREDTVVPSKKKRIERAIELMGELPTTGTGEVGEAALDKLQKKLEAERLQVVRTDLFPRNQRGFIPEVGLAEEVARQAFITKISQPVSPEPILSRGKLWAFRLLQREHPDKKQFEKEKVEFREEFIDSMRERIIEQFVGMYERSHDVNFDLHPLRIKYGVLQKK